MSFHRLSRADVEPGVGRDADAWCGRCGQELGHLIVAMVGKVVVRVRCNTCSGEHAYKTTRQVAATAQAKATKATRAPRAATAATGSTTRKASTGGEPSPAVRGLYKKQMASKDRAQAVRYSPTVESSAGLLIDHPKFGYGIIQSAAGGKGNVLFETGERTLVFDRE